MESSLGWCCTHGDDFYGCYFYGGDGDASCSCARFGVPGTRTGDCHSLYWSSPPPPRGQSSSVKSSRTRMLTVLGWGLAPPGVKEPSFAEGVAAI